MSQEFVAYQYHLQELFALWGRVLQQLSGHLDDQSKADHRLPFDVQKPQHNIKGKSTSTGVAVSYQEMPARGPGCKVVQEANMGNACIVSPADLRLLVK